MDDDDRSYLQALYKERAECADLESDAIDAKKYTRVGGFWWSVFEWFRLRLEKERHEIQQEIDEISASTSRGEKD